MGNKKQYVSGIIPDNEWIINYIRYRMDDLFDKDTKITVSRRMNIARRISSLFRECCSDESDKYMVTYLHDKVPGVTELYRANDAFFVEADEALIFWDMLDVYTIQEILLLLQRNIKVKLFLGMFNTPVIEVNSIDDLLSVLPPRREGVKSYGEELTIPRQLMMPCQGYMCAEQYRFRTNRVQPVGFSEFELVYLTETTGFSMDNRKKIYEEIMGQTDIIYNLVELAQKGSFKMQSIRMTAWMKHQEIIDAFDSLELKPNEHILVFNNWGTISMCFTNKADLLAYLLHINETSWGQETITIQKYICCSSHDVFPPEKIDRFSNEPIMILDTEYYYENKKIYDFRKCVCSNGYSDYLSYKTGFRRDLFKVIEDDT